MPSSTFNRRQLLQAAGGLSFLALSKMASAAIPPVFTALPYLQPGPKGSLLVPNQESLVIAWQTDYRAADFVVTVEDRQVVPERMERFSGDLEDGEKRYNYAATITGLALGKRYLYQVRCNGTLLAEGWFTTRKPRGSRIRFVAFGDNSYGDISDRMIAYQAFRARPDFVMNTGDTVYEDGTDNEYARHFFPVYNADQAGPRIGAPLLRAVPFYAVIANHDVHGKDAKGHPVADFAKTPDALAFFTNFYLPQNGLERTFAPTLSGPVDAIATFRRCAGDRFPLACTYSYDYGDAHFLCLDSNIYVDPNDTALQRFILSDLTGTDATWKFVVFHHPSFNVGAEHYTQQHMRALAPLFEQCGVDIVLHGHEHNYQRTVPLHFAPKNTDSAGAVGTKARLIPGSFRLDRRFDGKRATRAEGVIYLTTGAGGKHLYEADWGEKARTHPEDNHIDYMARFVSDRHSLTVFELDRHRLTFQQVDQWGTVIDQVTLTK